jgi:hypothetical protein
MKTKILIIVMASLALVSVASAQTNSSGLSNISPELKDAIISFKQDVEVNRTLTVALYPTYAPEIVVDGKKHQWGAGVALLCPATAIPALEDNAVADHAFGGIRLDMLGGQFFASTVAVGFKAHVQFFGHDFVPFVESGVNIPITGAGDKNAELGAMYGSGVTTSLFAFGKANEVGDKPGSINGFIAVEKWTQFKGYEAHVGASVTWKW